MPLFAISSPMNEWVMGCIALLCFALRYMAHLHQTTGAPIHRMQRHVENQNAHACTGIGERVPPVCNTAQGPLTVGGKHHEENMQQTSSPKPKRLNEAGRAGPEMVHPTCCSQTSSATSAPAGPPWIQRHPHLLLQALQKLQKLHAKTAWKARLTD